MEGDSQAWMRLRSTRHAKYWCAYHFVWIPKYRRDILVGEIAEYAREVITEIISELGCENLTVNVMPDYVHVFVLCPPRLAPAFIANYLEGEVSEEYGIAVIFVDESYTYSSWQIHDNRCSMQKESIERAI